MTRGIAVLMLACASGLLGGCSSEPQPSLDAGTGPEGGPEAGSAPDGRARPDTGEPTDDSGCDRPPPTKVGCLETPLPPTITVDGVARPVAAYACSGDGIDTMVRLRACISPPSNPCLDDGGEGFCAVIDIPASVLSSFPPDATMRLDGTTTFTFLSPYDYEVKPENVVYTPAQATA